MIRAITSKRARNGHPRETVAEQGDPISGAPHARSHQPRLRSLAVALAVIGSVALIGTLALTSASGAAPSEEGAVPPPERPSFLHILTDDQTIDSIRQMSQVEQTLGRGGASFSNYHDVQPLCCPSRASFLTGLYPHNHHVLDNKPPLGGYPAMDFSRTLYTAMDDAGYRTGWVGKVLNVEHDEGLVPAPGFDEWFTPLRSTELNMFNFTMSDNGVERDYYGDYQNDVWADRAKRFIEESSDDPFLLTLALTSPHWTFCKRAIRCPPQPDPDDAGDFHGLEFPLRDEIHGAKRRAYADRYWAREVESLQSVDRIVGELVDQLDQSGRLENTYVIFQSDNGYLHGEHRIINKNVPWDRSVRVPLLIRGPGFVPGSVRTDLTANVDVPATVLDLADVDPPLPPDGYSLLAPHRRKLLLMEKLPLNVNPHFAAWTQVKTTTGWTYWRTDGEDGRRFLFNLNRDPAQDRNLIRRKPKRVARLDRKLTQIENCANPCP